MEKSVKVGELEVPLDYFELSKEDKRDLCLNIVDAIITILVENLNPKIDKMDIMERLLDSSIQSNEQEENYEVCQVLNDIKKIINE